MFGKTLKNFAQKYWYNEQTKAVYTRHARAYFTLVTLYCYCLHHLTLIMEL